MLSSLSNSYYIYSVYGFDSEVTHWVADYWAVTSELWLPLSLVGQLSPSCFFQEPGVTLHGWQIGAGEDTHHYVSVLIRIWLRTRGMRHVLKHTNMLFIVLYVDKKSMLLPAVCETDGFQCLSPELRHSRSSAKANPVLSSMTFQFCHYCQQFFCIIIISFCHFF